MGGAFLQRDAPSATLTARSQRSHRREAPIPAAATSRLGSLLSPGSGHTHDSSSISGGFFGLWCAAWAGHPRLRDPLQDFAIGPTAPEAIAPPPPFRRLPGPYLAEHGDYVTLHLGNSTADGVHAVMDLRDPDDLVFSYTRIMAAFARFQPHPATIGMVGLGGGSLAKHCFRNFPGACITVAEISREVIALRRSFHVPEDNALFRTRQMDGLDFVRQSKRSFDVLLIDAFDEGGHLPSFATRSFFRDCAGALSSAGVLVLNFSGESWQSSARQLARVFRGRTLLYPCPDGDNVIAFATKQPLPPWATHSVQR